MKPPQIVLKDGKPSAVILDIDEYESLLEELQQREDLLALREARQQPLEYQTLDEFLRERDERV